MRKSENVLRVELEGFLAEVFQSFRLPAQRKWGATYVRGLMMEGGRKSAGAMALYVPGGDEQSLQQFVTDSPWDPLDVRRALVVKALKTFPEERYLIFDETGFPKQGNTRWASPDSAVARSARRGTARSP